MDDCALLFMTSILDCKTLGGDFWLVLLRAMLCFGGLACGDKRPLIELSLELLSVDGLIILVSCYVFSRCSHYFFAWFYIVVKKSFVYFLYGFGFYMSKL